MSTPWNQVQKPEASGRGYAMPKMKNDNPREPVLTGAVLSQILSDCPFISCEWSLTLLPERLESRKKFIGWINNSDNQAANWIEQIRPLLEDGNLIAGLDSGNIVNLGLGIGDAQTALYVHFRKDGRMRYLATAGSEFREYFFHHFPLTPDSLTPATFISARHREVFDTISQDKLLLALSGFWLRTQAGEVDQLSLSFIDRPPLRQFIPVLTAYSQADFSAYSQDHIKHIAFNQSGSITLYFSGGVPRFSADFATMQHAARQGAKAIRLRLKQLFAGIDLVKPIFDLSLPTQAQLTDWECLNRQLVGDDMDICLPIRQGEKVYLVSGRSVEISVYLQQKKCCDVQIAVVSMPQLVHCNQHGFPCRLIDLEASLPANFFDTIVLLESLELVQDKTRFLKNLRAFTRRLLIRTALLAEGETGCPVAGRYLHSKSTLIGLLENCGYRVSQMNRVPINPQAALDITTLPTHRFYSDWQDYITWRNQQDTLHFADIIAE